jgi:hypothetical protein
VPQVLADDRLGNCGSDCSFARLVGCLLYGQLQGNCDFPQKGSRDVAQDSGVGTFGSSSLISETAWLALAFVHKHNERVTSEFNPASKGP